MIGIQIGALLLLDLVLNGYFIHFLLAMFRCISCLVLTVDFPETDVSTTCCAIENDWTSWLQTFASSSKEDIQAVWNEQNLIAYVLLTLLYTATILLCIVVALTSVRLVINALRHCLPGLLLFTAFCLYIVCFDKLIVRWLCKVLPISGSTSTKITCVLLAGFAVQASRSYMSRRQNTSISSLPKVLRISLMSASFFAPLCMLLFHSKAVIFGCLFLMAALFELCYYLALCPTMFRSIRIFINFVETTVEEIGLQGVVEQIWVSRRVPLLLRAFWNLKILLLVSLLMFHGAENIPALHSVIKSGTVDFDLLCEVAKYLVARSCETCMSLLGTTSMVALLGSVIGRACLFYLNANADADEVGESNYASVLSGVLFFILCMQSNVTGLAVNLRLAKLYRNAWLLFMAVLHFLQSAADGTLTRLTLIGDYRWTSHLRPLSLVALVLLIPLYYLRVVWIAYDSMMFNPWILSVALFAVELLFKTTNSLVIYALNVIDAKLWGFYSNTESIVDGLKVTGAVVEFVFAVLMFFDGLFILFFDQGGILRSIMICIHAYCNIYQQAVEGWACFERRMKCSQKLNSFQDATKAQIEARDDVCPICFLELSEGSTKVTQCHHFFHTQCIKKLLQRQDRCPMCHMDF